MITIKPHKQTNSYVENVQLQHIFLSRIVRICWRICHRLQKRKAVKDNTQLILIWVTLKSREIVTNVRFKGWSTAQWLLSMGLACKTLGVIINSTKENEEFDADVSLIHIERKGILLRIIIILFSQILTKKLERWDNSYENPQYSESLSSNSTI